jgi:hypothetical protein
VVFNYVNNLCTAQWSNGSDRTLLCNEGFGAQRGFAVRREAAPDHDPDNRVNLLWTHPQMVAGGSIRGRYPYVRIPQNASLSGEIGCVSGYPECDITMQLYYQIYGSSPDFLDQSVEVADDQATPINLNLSSLRGRYVSFHLVVVTNGNPEEAAGYWLSLKLEAP